MSPILLFRYIVIGVLIASPSHAEVFDHQQKILSLELSDWTQALGIEPRVVQPLQCRGANASQISEVKQGIVKKARFLDGCARATGNSPWCKQLIRPNPSSESSFRCTYGSALPHELINPDESTWVHAFSGVNLVDGLERQGLRVCQIYNWWRPEPYNQNVGGAPGRHPAGTAIDVRFCSNQEAIKGFDALCIKRKKGTIRALGYYGSPSTPLFWTV